MAGQFRLATKQDAAVLSELAFRSKAHWGYSDELMTLWRDEFTMSPEDCAGGRVGVVEVNGTPAGFYQIGGDPPHGALMDLFVAPEYMGAGVGRQLLERAMAQGRKIGFTSLSIHSDPHAEAFYAHFGAVTIGSVPSTVVLDRTLPLMKLAL